MSNYGGVAPLGGAFKNIVWRYRPHGMTSGYQEDIIYATKDGFGTTLPDTGGKTELPGKLTGCKWLYVPADTSGFAADGSGALATNGVGAFHNNAEAKLDFSGDEANTPWLYDRVVPDASSPYGFGDKVGIVEKDAFNQIHLVDFRATGADASRMRGLVSGWDNEDAMKHALNVMDKAEELNLVLDERVWPITQRHTFVSAISILGFGATVENQMNTGLGYLGALYWKGADFDAQIKNQLYAIDDGVTSGNQISSHDLVINETLQTDDWVLLKSNDAITGMEGHNNGQFSQRPEELNQVSSVSGDVITLKSNIVDTFEVAPKIIKPPMLLDIVVRGIEIISDEPAADGHFLGFHFCAGVTLEDIGFKQGAPGGIALRNCANVTGKNITIDGFMRPYVGGETFGVVVQGGCLNCQFEQFFAQGASHTMTTTANDYYLFAVNGTTQSIGAEIVNLDTPTISTALTNEFSQHGFPLTSPSVTKLTAGSYWKVDSGSDVYYIVLSSSTQFKIYDTPYPSRWGTPRKITFDGGIHRAGQWLLFNSGPAYSVRINNLNENDVHSWMTSAFSGAGYVLTSATISDVVDDVEWQITDTLSNGAKKRYVIKNEDGNLNVYVNASYAFSPHAEGYDIRIKNSHVFVDMPGNVSCVLMRTRNSGAENVHFHGYPSNPEGPLEGTDYPSAFAKGYHATADNNDVLDCVIDTTFQGVVFDESDYTGHTSSGNVYRYNGRMGILNYTTGVSSTNDVFIDNGGRNPGKSFYNDAVLVSSTTPSEMTVDGGVFWHSDNQVFSIDTNGGTNSGHITVQNSVFVGFVSPADGYGMRSTSVIPVMPTGLDNHIVPDTYV
ncbi:MAG: hypothetical protein R3E01_35570 [Pirellulaceae bacterium]